MIPDEEWDSDSDNVEPKKDDRFKATIHVTDTSRRTYRAFIEYAICGALYFAPLRSAYKQYCTTPPGQSIHTHHTPWPEWAEAHITSHTIVPGFKTLSSPKSMYRLADMLIIPELKAICQKQIINSLDGRNVISEIRSTVV
ncbi:hypothetical protein DFH28DRAFT_227822 [Melampsora americana]|nr:hypothetical protein DFH28DRAFT_227822 [Melampsora americana]